MDKTKNITVFIVGVTGGIGSGKTAVTDFFARQGVCIVDADVVSKAVVEPGRPALTEIEQHFGSEILINGELDRRKLRTVIFDDERERQWLESLLHPMIREQIIQELGIIGSAYGILVSPLLLETDQHELVDRILTVDVPEKIQLARTMARDQITKSEALKILQSQMPRRKRVLKAR